MKDKRILTTASEIAEQQERIEAAQDNYYRKLHEKAPELVNIPIKPCPFCGADIHPERGWPGSLHTLSCEGFYTSLAIRCSRCGCHGPTIDNYAKIMSVIDKTIGEIAEASGWNIRQ